MQRLANMASSSALSQEEENYVRMALLLTGISPRAVRVLFDKEFPPASLSLTVNDKKVKQKLNDLSRKKVINKAQWDLLFPISGITDSTTFDVTLMIALLRNLPTVPLVPPVNGYDDLPVTTETTPASDIARIKHYRNILAHLHDGKVDGTLFSTAWTDISGAVFRVGGNAMKLECDQLMTKPLDMSSQEILRDVQQANKDIKSIKQSLDLIQSNQTGIKTDMETFKSGHDILKKSCDLLQVEQTESRADIVVLKSDHKNLKKSHDLLQIESKIDVKRVQKDLNTLKLDHKCLENSQGLLQIDQREVIIDVQNVKADCQILKTSQDLLQSDQIKTKEDVKKLTYLFEDPVPSNRRVLISSLLNEWQKNAENFVETRAARCALKSIKENSCLTITASSGVGKTSILRHVALQMKEKEGYDVLPVSNPNDMIKFYNPNQKTLFVIDDFCGTYSINQSDLNNWEPVMEEIKMLIKTQLTKIIVACRLQVYQDEKFESLSIYRTSVCNLLSEDLCLLQKEKMLIAELYLETKASYIIQYCDLYDCFPLLCKLFSDNPELNLTYFFKNPFSVYETEIDKLYKNGHNTKYCALALCVMFNNNLTEELFSEEIDVETRKIIENTYDACRLDRGTSRIVLLDELNSLEHTFIKKEQGVLKTKHDKLFDLLVYYFGQRMIHRLIRNAHPIIIMQRFLLERRDDIGQFITIVPPKYHEMYLERMIDDWLTGRLWYVFHNINLKTQEFRQKFLCYLKKSEISLQRRLALKTDINSKDTALKLCCYYGDIPFIHWCINHGVCVNLCNRRGWSPLLAASCNGHTETVKILLDNKADINNCDANGRSALHFACENNHLETVMVLLDNKHDINKCSDNGASALHFACENNHIETVKVLLDNKANINKCADNGLSPLYIACETNRIETVKVLLDNKADINKCTDDGASPLHIACQNNYIEIVKALLDKKADINKCTDDGVSPLDFACKDNHIEIVKVLLDNKAHINKCTNNGVFSPLYIACQNNHIETVKVLLDNKADINECIDIACIGASPLYIACHNNHKETVKILLDNKADINKCTDNGASPLYIACYNDHIEIVKVLLDNNANINKCDDNGVSPLYMACLNNNIEIVKVLLDNNADINKCEDNRVSSLYVACHNNHIKTVKLLLDNKADTTKCNEYGVSPLIIACHNNHIEIVKVLLDKKADINKCTDQGESPLYVACKNNHIDIVNVLLDNNADINKCSYKGNSPLVIACHYYHIETVKVLLDSVMIIYPLYIFRQNSHTDVLKKLLMKGSNLNK